MNDTRFKGQSNADDEGVEPIYVLPDKPWPPGPAPLPRCRGCGRAPMAVPRHTKDCEVANRVG